MEEAGGISALGWIGIAIAAAGWWISSAIEDFTEAYKEIHDPQSDEDE